MQKLWRFFLGAGVSFGLNILITYIGVDILNYSLSRVYIIAQIIVTICSFFISLHYTFRENYKHIIAIKYIITLSLFNSLNYMLVQLFSDYFGGGYKYFIILGVTTFIFFMKYIIYDKIVFIKKT